MNGIIDKTVLIIGVSLCVRANFQFRMISNLKF